MSDPRNDGAGRELPVSVLMFIAYRAAENRIVGAVQAAGFDITLAQSRLLARLAPEGTRISELAEQAQVTKQTATALVDRLEASGYVERIPDPRDGRARVVRLTEMAQEHLAPIARREEERLEAEWSAHLGKDAMAELRASLTRLREITDPFAG
jgi:DNA-binding MarR family transcriptional regulator